MKINPVHTNTLVNIYSRSTIAMYRQLLAVEKTNKQYHDFFVKVRLQLFDLSKKDKRFKPLYKRLDKFLKKWN